MRGDLLLQQFDTIVATQEDIVALEGAVLDLAVRGQLVPQHPGDSPAAELLERILAENRRLIKAGEIRRPKTASPIEPNEIPYTVPDVRRRL